MRASLWKFILVICIFLSACTPRTAGFSNPVVPSTAPVPTAAPSATPTITQVPPSPVPTDIPPSPTPTPVPALPLPNYTMDVDFFYDRHGGHVEEVISYPNATGQALTDLRLMVPLYQYQGAITLTGLSWSGGGLDGRTVENAVIENIQVVIPLPQPLQPGETLGLKVAYDFVLPLQSEVAGERPMPIGATGRQVNLVDWYAFVPPYRAGSGWLAHPPSYYGENLVYDMADFNVNLRFADGRNDLTVAASAAATQDGEWLRYQRAHSRSFALSIGQEYVVETAQSGNTTVSSYYFPLNEAAGKRALQATVEALEYFSALFGPYPHDTLAVVEADFYDGMEYDGLYFLSRAFYNVYQGSPAEYLVAIAAHETAHQWWYGLVGNDQANEPWLDEALCTYSERLYYEHYYPEALDWWWQYRIDYYNPSGWVNTSVYNPQGSLQTYQDYRNAVYLNGAHFFEDLRQLIGDDVFFAFLNQYAAEYAEKIAFQADFFSLLGQFTQADIAPLLQKYFYTP